MDFSFSFNTIAFITLIWFVLSKAMQQLFSHIDNKYLPPAQTDEHCVEFSVQVNVTLGCSREISFPSFGIVYSYMIPGLSPWTKTCYK